MNVLDTQHYILRCDDFDPRLNDRFEEFKSIHQEFVKRKKIITITVNTCIGHTCGFNKEVVDYVNEWTAPGKQPSLDIQLHGWHHDRCWTMLYKDIYPMVLANLTQVKRDFIYSDPKVFYPPWNQSNEECRKVCTELGLTMGEEGKHIRQYWWLGISKIDITVFFWHWWDKEDIGDIIKIFPLMEEDFKNYKHVKEVK